MKTFIKVCVIVLITIAYFFILDYFTNQAVQRKAKIDGCLAFVTHSFDTDWAKQCNSLGKTDPYCSLPTKYSATVNNTANQRQKDCFKRFPQ